jgi:hypothetical protein
MTDVAEEVFQIEDKNDIKEDLSYAYLHSISAVAGFSCAPYPGKDRISIDAEIGPYESYTTIPGRVNPRLFVQLKATSTKRFNSSNVLPFPLPINNYDDLRSKDGFCKILMVLLLPENPSEWLKQTEDELASRKCAYWLNLMGMESRDDCKTNVTVYLKKDNVLSSETISTIMEKLSRMEVV